MGQLTEKAKQKLSEIGIEQLPIQYRANDDQSFGSENTLIKLTAFAVLLNPKDIDAYFESLKFRKTHPEYIVQVNYVDVKKYNSDYCKLIAYIERININLEQIISLPFEDMAKIIYFSLKGFKILFEKYGYFTIQSMMIGINDVGEIKVWLNRKHSDNQPKVSYSYAKMTNPQQNMVNQLKEIFKCKTERKTIPNGFQLEAKTFIGLIQEYERKFAPEFFVNKVQIDLTKAQNPQKAMVSTIASNSESPNRSIGPQIRFNYQLRPAFQPNSHTASQKNISVNQTVSSITPRITFNNRSASVSAEPRQARSTSIKNVNFNYKNKTPERRSSPIKELIQTDVEPRQVNNCQTTPQTSQFPKVNFNYQLTA